MHISLTDRQQAHVARARAVGGAAATAVEATAVVRASADAGLFADLDDVLGIALAVEAMTTESAAAGMTLALHGTVAFTLRHHPRGAALQSGAVVGGLALSSETLPTCRDGRLTGDAHWVGPLAGSGLALVGARWGDEIVAAVAESAASGVTSHALETSALPGLQWADLTFDGVPGDILGAPAPAMAVSRTLIASVAIGIGARALRESLAVVRRGTGAAGEQTVQGLLADSATELDAARVLVWHACGRPLSLAEASMAKLAATVAAQQAVARATQVVGVSSILRGHVIEQLTHDVRAIELFAGRTEALRDAVAGQVLPARQAPPTV